MKLDKDTKARIDQFFDQITPDALLKLAVEEYGFEFDNGLNDSGAFEKLPVVSVEVNAPTVISSGNVGSLSLAC